MMPNNIDTALRTAAIQIDEQDVFILLAENARFLAQYLMDVDEVLFNRAYNDRVCAYKMGRPICSVEEAAVYGIELYANIDDVNQALGLFTVNINSESSEFTLFCHKHNGYILIELS